MRPDSEGLLYHGDVPARERDPEVSKAFGRAIRIARLRLSLERVDVAQRAGVLPGTIGRIERGEREPALSVLMRLATALRMSGSELVEATERELRAARAREVPEGREEETKR